jgi:hypothetical protein
MNYGEALEKYSFYENICIVVKTKKGLRTLAKYNFCGGVCECCKECDDDESLIVKKIINIENMEILFEAIN